MKHAILLVLGITGTAALHAQTTVTGKVTNRRNEPVAAASLRIKETGQGTLADSLGNYRIRIIERGKKTLEVSALGYRTIQSLISPTDSVLRHDIVLKNAEKELGEVVIVSAGSFEASDKAKGASLTPMDAVTVAGNGGDIAAALRFLPGSQHVGEKEGLFVRGGTSEESKQFVDGILLKNPNYPAVPGLPQPARLNPFLFKGILFNTGGYSALYGEALSSALILESVDLPDESAASLHIFPMSAGAGFQKRTASGKGSYGVDARYGSYRLYNKVVRQKPDFFHDPEYVSVNANFRLKTGKTGMLKFYSSYGYNHTGMRNPDLDSLALLSSFETKGSNIYTNLSYRESFGPSWKLDAALAWSYNNQAIGNSLEDHLHRRIYIAGYPYAEKNNDANTTSHSAQGRFVLTKTINRRQAVRFGAEHFYNNDHTRYNDSLKTLTDHLTAAFAEADIYIARNVAAKAGLRAEFSSLLQKANIAPRLSIAYRLNDGGQFNMAYGVFHQQPALLFLMQVDDLAYTRAEHYILNYQRKARNRLFRIEAYYKKYRGLVTTEPKIDNAGSGYAKGIEVFFRDKRTFKNVDYWITYTYLDTKRKYLNYPYSLQPDFATPHTASVAVKRFFPDINFNANLSYALATGRPYYNIQNDRSGKPHLVAQGTTKMYNQMNLSFAYLFTMFKKWKHKDFSGIGIGINNVLGTTQVFGYNYSYNGRNRMPVTQPASRGFYLGLFMAFGIDSRENFINENL